MDTRMSTNIDDIIDPALEEFNPNQPSETDLYNIQKEYESQIPSPDLSVKNPNITNVQANVSVKKSFTDTFLTESNILLIIIIIIASLPQLNRYLLQVLPKNFQNEIFIISLKAILLCVIYITIVHYLL